jgi:hypothetical protein
LPPPIEATIVRLKREYPSWGAPETFIEGVVVM